MNQYQMLNPLAERRSEPRRKSKQYYSAEFTIEGLDIAYQFKLMNFAPSSMAVLVKENSDILNRIRVGDTLDVKYYSVEPSSSFENLTTTIRHITRNDQGRLKGHVLIGLEIIDSRY